MVMISLRLLICLILIAFSTECYSQLYVGVKGTYSLSLTRSQEIKYDDAQDFLTYKVRFLEQDVSPSIQAFAYYRNDLIYVQGEVGYRSIKTRFTTTNFITLGQQTPVEHIKKTNYLIFPLSAGIRVANFKIGAGPVFSWIIGENPIFEEITDFEERRSNLETGFSFNFGMALYRLHIDLSYELKFNSVGDYLYYRQDYKGFDTTVQYINLGLGYLF